MTGIFHALISPQGHVEYNAEFVIGAMACAEMEHGRWYTNEDLGKIAGRLLLLRDSPQAIEKNIKKWRYERQVFGL